MTVIADNACYSLWQKLFGHADKNIECSTNDKTVIFMSA